MYALGSEYTRCNKFPDVKLANQVVYDFLAIKLYLAKLLLPPYLFPFNNLDDKKNA